jgi:hypothetical protein
MGSLMSKSQETLQVLVFEREVGGLEGELTVICHPANQDASCRADKPQKPAPELTAEQTYVCDHATD